jgi:inorganic phosphate transporter, PiT family
VVLSYALFYLLGGVYLGWSLGANDTANVFGTAVASRMVRFSTAAILSSTFVLAGAWLEGQAGIETIRAMSGQSLQSATLTAVSAAISITVMTLLRIPSSTSQAVVGSLIGIGLFGDSLNLSGLPKVVLCWIGTPIGALLVAAILYRSLGALLNRAQLTMYSQDQLMRAGLVLSGCYGAYALGANNVANVTGVYTAAGLLNVQTAVLVGGASIAVGVITYSKPVMMTVGRSIMRLDAFSSLVVVLAEAITVHFYAWVGVPVSTSQAVVGAVIGVGLLKQANAIRAAVVLRICLGWLATPLIAFAFAVGLHFATHLQYVP